MRAAATPTIDADARLAGADDVPADWSPYPSPEEIAAYDALLAKLGPVERDEPHPSEVGEHPLPLEDAFADPAALLGLLTPDGSAADPFDLGLLAALDPELLDHPQHRLRVLTSLDRVEGLVQALRIRAVIALAGTEHSGEALEEMHLDHEIAVARRTSEYAAEKLIDLSRTVTTSFPDFLPALEAGRVSWSHLAVLVERTRMVLDETAREHIAARALAKALTRTPGQFATEVEKLVARFDPDAADRHRRAREKQRRVWVKQLGDGLGMLGYVDEWSVVNAVYETIAADAREAKKARAAAARAARGAQDSAPEAADDCEVHVGAGTPAESPCADGGRADALAARVLGSLQPDGSITWDRRASVQVHCNLVMDFETWTGERDRIALLDGQPIPAEIAREFSGRARTYRRFITDPFTGCLIDRGTAVYTDEHLRLFTIERDICRNPVHHHQSGSIQLQMDHAEEFPHGATSAGNCGALCVGAHQLKTHRRVDITDSRADGSCTWTTRWGQVIQVPPRPVLEEPDPRHELRVRQREPEPDPPDDIPPF